MDILAKLPRELKGQVFLFMRHPVAETFRFIWLQPAWYRDAVKMLNIIGWLNHAFLSEDYDSMRELLLEFDEHFRFLKDRACRTVELPPQMERRLLIHARMYKRIYDARREGY